LSGSKTSILNINGETMLTKEKTILFSKKIVEFHEKKVNFGCMEDADIAFAYTGPCGDTIKLYIKVDGFNRIADAKFEYNGCIATAASASALTTLIKGLTIKQAKTVTEKEILLKLGELPESQRHCPRLAVTTLRKAIEKYEKEKTSHESKM